MGLHIQINSFKSSQEYSTPPRGVEEWNNIPHGFIDNVIRGIPRVVNAILQSGGGYRRL